MFTKPRQQLSESLFLKAIYLIILVGGLIEFLQSDYQENTKDPEEDHT